MFTKASKPPHPPAVYLQGFIIADAWMWTFVSLPLISPLVTNQRGKRKGEVLELGQNQDHHQDRERWEGRIVAVAVALVTRIINTCSTSTTTTCSTAK